MKCVVTRMCWPNADTVWKPGQVVDVTPDEYQTLRPFLEREKPPKVEKVVKDGPTE